MYRRVIVRLCGSSIDQAYIQHLMYHFSLRFVYVCVCVFVEEVHCFFVCSRAAACCLSALCIRCFLDASGSIALMKHQQKGADRHE